MSSPSQSSRAIPAGPLARRTSHTPRAAQTVGAALACVVSAAIGRPLVGRPAAAQQPAPPAADRGAADTRTGVLARTFELRPLPGLTRQFEDGYRRHLDWHARAGDRWAWGMWQVTNGDRAGLYVDGTFGHAWAGFDAAVDPAGDAADNAVNVDPFAARGANHVWRLRPDLGGAGPVAAGAALPASDPGPAFVWRAEYRVRGGAEDAFGGGARRLRAAAAGRPFAVYELVSGGERPTYAVWVPAATWAAAGAFADAAAPAERALAAAAERVRVEVWRFRPDLSLCADAAARCHAQTRPGPPVSR